MFFYFCADIIQTYIMFLFMRSSHRNLVKNKKIELLTYGIFHCVGFFLYMIIRLPIIMFLVSLFTTFLVTLNYKASLNNRLASIATFFIMDTFAESILVFILEFKSLSLFIKVDLISHAAYFMLTLLKLIFVLAYIKLRKVKFEKYILRGYRIYNIVNFIIFFIINIIDLYTQNSYFMYICFIILLTNWIIVLLYDIAIIHDKERKDKLIIIQENKSYQKQLEIMNMYTNNNDNLVHDMKNSILVIKHLIEGDRKAEALEQLEKIAPLFAKNSLVKTGVKIVDSVLNFKLFEAKYYKTKLDYKITVPYDISYDEFDITLILGKVMDFAIENTKKAPLEEREIYFRMKFEMDKEGKGWLKIKSVHPVLQKDAAVEKTKEVFESIITTLEKYKGMAKYGIIDDQFEMNIKMQMI